MLDNPPGAAPFVSVNAIKTELVRRGRGSPLLFLHPELGIAPGAPVLDTLAASFDVVAPSLPGADILKKTRVPSGEICGKKMETGRPPNCRAR